MPEDNTSKICTHRGMQELWELAIDQVDKATKGLLIKNTRPHRDFSSTNEECRSRGSLPLTTSTRPLRDFSSTNQGHMGTSHQDHNEVTKLPANSQGLTYTHGPPLSQFHFAKGPARAEEARFHENGTRTRQRRTLKPYADSEVWASVLIPNETRMS